MPIGSGSSGLGSAAIAAQELVQKDLPDQAAVTFMDYLSAPCAGFNGLPTGFQSAMLQNASTLKPFLASPPAPPFSCDDANKIEAPTLLIVGEKTHQFRRLLASELQRCLPNAVRVEIPGVGHPLEMINPKDFNTAVLQFLATH